MNIIKSDDTINIFNFEENTHLLEFNILCFKYTDLTGVTFNVFTVDFISEEYLEKYYSEINELIAIKFQSKLHKNVEKWNIYIFYFVQSKIDSNIKKNVEQDKYATRKIVLENNNDYLTEEKKLEIVSNKLFKLKINGCKNLPQEDGDKNIDEIINDDKELSGLINKIIENNFKSVTKKREWLEKETNSFLEV